MHNQSLPVQKIAHNTIIQIVGKAANILIGVLAIAFLTRYLSPDGYGKYTTVLSFLQIFGIILDFGLYLVLLQEISKKNADRNYIFSNVLTLRIISGLTFFIVVPILVLFFPYSKDVKLGIVFTSVAFFLNALIQVYGAIFQKEMTMYKVVLAETIAKVFFLGLILLFIFLKGNLILILIANIVNAAVFFFILARNARKYVKFKWTIDLVYWKEILRLSWPIAITTILNLIYFKADTLILSLYKPQSHVGLYGAAYKVLEILTTLPHLILGLVLPIFAIYWFEKRNDELKNIFQKIFNMFVILTFIIVVIFTAEAKGIINFIAGKEYGASVGLLKILIWPTVIIFFGSFFNYGIIAIEKQKNLIKYFLISAVFAMAGYLIFIPRFSYYGAAYITLFVELLMAIFSYFLLRKHTQWKVNLKLLFQVLFISLFVFAILEFISFHFIIEIIIAGILYFGLLFIFGIISRDLIKEIIKPKNKEINI